MIPVRVGWVFAFVLALPGDVLANEPARSSATTGGVVALRTPGPDQVLIRAGTFTMGSTEEEMARAMAACESQALGEDCKPVDFSQEWSPHPVYLSDYWIDRTEVTVAAYRRCVSTGRCVEPPFAAGGSRFDQPDLPVTLVTWNDAMTYCKWAGGRLPTEAEWERAARGLRRREYPWGDVYNRFLSNHGRPSILRPLDDADGFLELAPVGSYPDGRTPDGIADLAGNVEEWVLDWYAPEYPPAEQHDPRGPDQGDERVVRGGSYMSRRHTDLRGAARGRAFPTDYNAWRGFRCVRPAAPPTGADAG